LAEAAVLVRIDDDLLVDRREQNRRIADHDRRPRRDVRALDALAVEPGPVGRIEIGEQPALVGERDLAVKTRNLLVVEREIVSAAIPPRRYTRVADADPFLVGGVLAARGGTGRHGQPDTTYVQTRTRFDDLCRGSFVREEIRLGHPRMIPRHAACSSTTWEFPPWGCGGCGGGCDRSPSDSTPFSPSRTCTSRATSAPASIWTGPGLLTMTSLRSSSGMRTIERSASHGV